MSTFSEKVAKLERGFETRYKIHASAEIARLLPDFKKKFPFVGKIVSGMGVVSLIGKDGHNLQHNNNPVEYDNTSTHFWQTVNASPDPDATFWELSAQYEATKEHPLITLLNDVQNHPFGFCSDDIEL